MYDLTKSPYIVGYMHVWTLILSVTAYGGLGRLGSTTGRISQLVARRTNNRNVVSSIPANEVCLTVDR